MERKDEEYSAFNQKGIKKALKKKSNLQSGGQHISQSNALEDLSSEKSLSTKAFHYTGDFVCLGLFLCFFFSLLREVLGLHSIYSSKKTP